MGKPVYLGVVVALAAATAGCATKQTNYRWGNYDDALYALYKNPQNQKAFVASLKTIILESDRAGVKIPPGIYAEYGFALYEEGSTADAVVYFQKEMDAWPESRAFMEKMMANAQRRPRPGPASGPSPTGPAGSVERRTGS
jgi:hypothetical protein